MVISYINRSTERNSKIALRGCIIFSTRSKCEQGIDDIFLRDRVSVWQSEIGRCFVSSVTMLLPLYVKPC